MNTVAIASSTKFYTVAAQVAALTADRGVRVHTPDFDANEETGFVDARRKADLTHRFLLGLRDSVCLYIVATGGYTGHSVAIEAGFAIALGIPIFASHHPAEPAIQALLADVIPPDRAPHFLSAYASTIGHAYKSRIGAPR